MVLLIPFNVLWFENIIQNYGAFLEKDGAGFRGQIKLTGFKNGDIDLSKLLWTYQVYVYNFEASTLSILSIIVNPLSKLFLYVEVFG